VFIDSLPSNGRPILARVDSHGNIFTESLRSNGHTRHNIFLLLCVIVLSLQRTGLGNFRGLLCTAGDLWLNWKGFGRKRSWPNRGKIPIHVWRLKVKVKQSL
jgi:hypothetical protein